MKTWQLYLSLALVSIHFWSGTINRRTHVVERSKKDVPHWSELTPLELIDVDQLVRMVMVRKAMRDLPLAIKQTQFLATSNLKALLLDSLAKPVREDLDKLNDMTDTRRELEKILEDLAKHEIFNQIKVQDIYFETFASQGAVTGDANSTHDVYVLAQFSKDDQRQLRSLFHEALGLAKNTSLRRFGSDSAKSEL